MVKLWLSSTLYIAIVVGTVSVSYVYCKERSNRLPDCSVRPRPIENAYGRDQQEPQQSEQSSFQDSPRDLILVSTLDGHVSALDTNNEGKLLWSHNTGQGSLLSSSISQMEINSNGRPIRLIPSLDGHLYKLNGETLEPIPVSAESLLKSSFKLGDDAIITGGIDSSSYGISLQTGELRYSCSMSGCTTNGQDVSNEEDILVVRRLSQTVRAVAPRTGEERWNFSVGEHQVTFLEKIEADCSGGKQQPVNSQRTQDVYSEKLNMADPHSSHRIRVIVPEGLIAASTKDKENKLVWSHRFDSPIVHTWLLKNGKLETFDLFDQKQVAILPKKGELDAQPLLYIGSHQKQLYIQQSLEMKRMMHSVNGNPAVTQALPRIEWKPYSVSGVSRTPYINHGRGQPSGIAFDTQNPSTALVLKYVDILEYPFDSGYYLYSTTSLQKNLDNLTVCPNDAEEEGYDDNIITSLWHWWKEVLGISLFSSLLVHLIFTRRAVKQMKRRMLAESSNSDIKIVSASTPPLSSDDFINVGLEEKLLDVPNIQLCEYKSRYTTDFEPIQRLGKGGFGVVYEARNKIDDCHYAIKRILLPPRVDAQEKVMREVRALAKLDHLGIVRYFNAWQESPPPRWQEQHDQQWEENSQIYSGPTSKPTTIYSETPKINKTKLVKTQNPFKMGENLNFSNFNQSDNESGSFSFEREQKDGSSMNNNNNNNNDSFEVVFQSNSDQALTLGRGDAPNVLLSDSDSNVSESDNTSFVPFGRKKTVSRKSVLSGSSSVQFEDSGCADRSRSTDEEEMSVEHSNKSDIGTKEVAVRPDELNLFGKEVVSDVKISHETTQPLYLYIQMQLCRKETLKDWMSVHTERNHDEILDIFDQIVSAVQYVHDCNLMHRDLKPSNIFFSVDGTIKVGDFGLVTALTESEIHTPAERSQQIHTHPFLSKHTDQVGTQLYMSPEQDASNSYSHKVDIFSLGLIFFELLVPFSTQMERGMVMLKVKQHIFPEDFMTQHPEECVLVKKLLSHDPVERPSALEIKHHPLFKAYQPQPEILSRFRRRRTYSHRMSSSGSECDSQTLEDH